MLFLTKPISSSPSSPSLATKSSTCVLSSCCVTCSMNCGRLCSSSGLNGVGARVARRRVQDMTVVEMLARIHRKLCTTLAELLSEARKDPCFDQRRRFAALRRMSPACPPPPPQIGKRTKGRQACETSCATSCLTARRTCTSVMGIVAGQPMTRLTPMTRPLRRRICTRPADLTRRGLGSASTCQSEDLPRNERFAP